MNDNRIASLDAAIASEHFPEVDVKLRQGVHIGQEEGSLYHFLYDAQDVLEPFYRRFGWQLMHQTDGYYYLLPHSDNLGRSRLDRAEMLVGQVLALFWLDPQVMSQGYTLRFEQVASRLADLLGETRLVKTLNPQRKKTTGRVAQKNVRQDIRKALHGLQKLGFIGGVKPFDEFELKSPLMRFAEPVRAHQDREKAMEMMVRDGKVICTDASADDAHEMIASPDLAEEGSA